MNKLVVKTPNQLKRFLQILAEESVAAAQLTPNNARQQQSQVAADIKQSTARFMREEDPAPTAAQPKPEKSEPAPEPAPSSTAPTKEISAKFDALADAINALRGGGSLRNADIEQQLRDYYNKLDSAEAASAILYIQTIADVLNKNVEGASARDPSDFNIFTTMGDKEKAAAEPRTAAPSKPIEQPSEEPEPEEAESETEKIEPPIKVGASQQVTETYRQRIRSLIRGQ